MEQSVDKPLVSIIMGAYNCSQTIGGSIQSIIDQTYSNWELIICDDCSTDNTYELLKEWESRDSRIRLFRNENNLHQAAARNRCIKASVGEYIMIQDADDVCTSNRVETLMAAFDSEVDFVGSGCWLFDDSSVYSEKSPRVFFPKPKDLLWGIPFVHASIMFRKACLDAVGGYRICHYTKRGEDYDLILRLYAAGFRGKNIADILYGYRVDRNTLSRRTFGARLDEMRIRWHGFRLNGILFPLGWLYALKPIPAHLYHIIKLSRYK